MRTIVHLDADAFFVSVEQAADVRLREKPVAVGGEKRGIIASASYEARKFGVYTPMPTVQARRLCPKLIVLPGDFEKYERFSRWMFSYAYDFTPDVEISSIDEGYFDLSGTRKSPLGIAETIRRAIRESLKISVSEGIASNKLVSQIASKLHKPAAFTEVAAGHEIPFLHPLPNHWLPGIGPKTATRLNAAGLAEIGQIAATPLDLLHLLMGNTARQIKDFSNARDDRPVVPVSEPAKSYSQQETFAADTTDEEYVEAVLHRQADHLMAKVRQDGKGIRTLTVKVRYNDMAEDQCSESLLEPTNLETDLYPRLRPMLRRAWKRRVSLRMVSLKLSNVYSGFFEFELALERAARQREARQRLAAAVDELRKTRGERVIFRGHDFLLDRIAGGDVAVGPVPLPGATQVGRGVPAEPLSRGGHPGESLENGSAGGFALPERNLVLHEQAIPPPERAGGIWQDRRQNLFSARSADRFPKQQPKTRAIPLAVHSFYSFLDSTLSIDAIIELAKQHELPAIALTDFENLHGAVAFAQAAKAAGIKPIIGTEIDLQGKPLRLYVQNATGYTNLCRILTQLARFKLQAAGFPTDGLLAASADPRLASNFPGRFYLEVSNPEALRKLPRDTKLPLVAALPCHYASADDRLNYDAIQSIRTLTLLRQQHPQKRLDGDFHFRSRREMQELFGSHPEVLAHSEEIAARCEYEFTFGRPQFPAYTPPGGLTPKQFLRQLVMAGATQRYGTKATGIKTQIEEELAIIGEVGYEEYFLVVWDLLQDCHRLGIQWLTRGSAADSLVCYCLGISDVCPIRFDLYFRRFLNKDRMQLNKLPDIDIDFPHDRKDDVIDLILKKYGREHSAVVGGFSTYQARGAVADIAKVLGVSEYQVRRFTEHFPWASAGCITEALQQVQECRDLPVAEEPYATALRMAAFLDGFPRYPKMHPCGVVLSRQPMGELTPTFISQKGYPTTHYDMDAVEAIGLIKIDILAQGGLAVMRDVKKLLEPRGIELDLANCEARKGLENGTAEKRPRRVGTALQNLAEIGTSLDPLEGSFEISSFPHSSFSLTPAATQPWNHPEVWELIASGGARAVHHIESPAMVGLCRMCNVREIDGLVAIVSVIRPGAANEQKKARFVRRYQKLEPPEYPDPSLEPALRSTFGLVVYEEHILQMCEAFAGLPPGRADILRRALGKQKKSVIQEIAREFLASATARGHSLEKIEQVWNLIIGFSGYAFCKAHSTAYAVEAYQSAWLKKYFPAEFMAGVLTNGKGFYHPLVYALECHRLGIPLLPPWINEPGPGFTVVRPEAVGRGVPAEPPCSGASKREERLERARISTLHAPDAPRRLSGSAGGFALPNRRFIRVPVTRVKGLTQKTIDKIMDEFSRGAFESLRDFYRRVVPLAEEMEALIRVGAFDNFGQSRTAQFWEAQHLQRIFHSDDSGQGWLLPPPGAGVPPSVCESTRRERLEAEAALLDFPASGHPLELYDNIAWETYCPVSRLGEFPGEEIVTCGLVIEQRIHHQVTGEPMKFLTLADWTGIIETELFASTYKSYGLATVRYPVLEITARVEPFENGRGHSLRVIKAGKPRVKPQILQ